MRLPDRLRFPILLGGAVISALLFYLIVYPLKGTHVPLGLDTPIYVWWSRLAGAAGLRIPAIGGRPLVVGALAALSDLTSIPEARLIVAIGPVLSVAMSAAIACLVYEGFGHDRLDFVLTFLLVNFFSVNLVLGYFSTLAFAAVFFAGMTCLVEGMTRHRPASTVAAGVLIGLAVLAHPIFAVLAVPLIAGGVLGLGWMHDPQARRNRLRADVPLLVLTVAVAGVVAAVGLALSGGPRGGLLTSADGLLHATGLGNLLVTVDRRRLINLLPPFLVISAAAAFLLAAAIGPVGRSRASVAFEPTWDPRGRFVAGVLTVWASVTVVGVALLLMRFAVPAQRLMILALFAPAIAALALSRLLREYGHDIIDPGSNRTRLRAKVGILFCVVGVLALAVNYWVPWWQAFPEFPAAAASDVRASARLLAGQPAGTPLILVTDEHNTQYVMDRVNYLRSVVPARRAADVYAFIGSPAGFIAGTPSLGGTDDQDAAAQYLSTRIPPPTGSQVVVVLRSFDPDAYRAVAGDGVWVPAADGVAVLESRLAGTRYPHSLRGLGPDLGVPGPALSPPWFALWSAAVLITILAGVGIIWTNAILGTSPLLIRIGLSPAVGLAFVGLAAIVADRIGLRLSSGGGGAAIVAVFVVGCATAALRRRRSRSFDSA